MVRDLLLDYERFVDQSQSVPGLEPDLAETHCLAAKIIEEVGAVEANLTAENPDNFAALETLLTRLRYQFSLASTEIGQDVFLRINNPLDQGLEMLAFVNASQ